jgi:DNA-binding transcriptional ArsR family regulator
MSNSDPLARLVKSEEELLDRELLAAVLERFVYVDRERGKVLLTKEGMSRPAREKILLYLLGRKALKALGGVEAEAVAPKEMEGPTGLKGATLRPGLKSLYDAGVLARDEKGYYVPVYNVQTAAGILRGG